MESASYDSVAIRVVGLAGSLRSGSVQYALRGAAEKRALTGELDLATYGLPFFGREGENDNARAVERFRADLRAADGIILGSPELHGSVSGVLKNALDLASAEEFGGKMVGLLAVAGGRMGATDTLSHLRTIGRSLHAWVVPLQASIGDSGKAFDSNGEPADPELAERLKAIGSQVAHFARLHKCEAHVQFMREWEGAAVGEAG
jgi:NAD(P)H-dependent FMN reductase